MVKGFSSYRFNPQGKDLKPTPPTKVDLSSKDHCRNIQIFWKITRCLQDFCLSANSISEQMTRSQISTSDPYV